MIVIIIIVNPIIFINNILVLIKHHLIFPPNQITFESYRRQAEGAMGEVSYILGVIFNLMQFLFVLLDAFDSLRLGSLLWQKHLLGIGF